MALVSQPVRIPRASRESLIDPFLALDQSHPVSQVDPVSRGRDPSPKRTQLSLPASPPPSPGAVQAQQLHFHSHHHLPPVSDAIPNNPILYLPPLLSPLPDQPQYHQHRDVPTVQELANFETRLPHIDPASLVLHQALHQFQPVDDRYAARPYSTAFNWHDLTLPEDVEREWYCVVFRSRRKPESSSLSLYQADREAHEEAVHNGGLVMYWYGVPDHTGLNLATCIWQSRRHAVKAISGPKHMIAMKQAAGAYEVYELERWILRKQAGETGLSLEKWPGGEVGW